MEFYHINDIEYRVKTLRRAKLFEHVECRYVGFSRETSEFDRTRLENCERENFLFEYLLRTFNF